MSIFREYDIRGVYGTTLTEKLAEDIGRAFGTLICRGGGKSISMGHDVRLSTPSLRKALLTGILSTGVNVVDIGSCPTPVLYFSLYTLNVDGGVMITASHNPAEHNGFKLCAGKQTIFGEDIQGVKLRIDRQDFDQGSGSLTVLENFLLSYRDYCISHFKPFIRKKDTRPLRVVMDCGNGAAGLIAPEIFKKLGADLILLYCEPDGRFPNHHPDPTVAENLTDLILEVKKHQADLGIAFDGDGDRLGVIDEHEEIIWGDRLTLLFAAEILKEHPGATIVSEVKASQVLYDEVARLGGAAIMWKAGHSLIKAKMRETGALLAGEMSGHLFFADRYFGYDDAIYAACRLAEILVKGEKPLSSYFTGCPQTFSTPELRVDCPDDKKFEVVSQCRELLSREYKTIDIDGVRFLFNGGWGLVRASNTQPALVLRFEADQMSLLKEMEEKVRRLLIGLC
ncbi:MAG: phosphomannomutase/phosphoglucomutase [Nitrospirae bacterium]|nr:phosphomannomutase/phosphoglucomutase [Candidatus Troglogloeales bacterium]